MFIALSPAEIESMFIAATEKEIYKLAAERVIDEDLNSILIFKLCDTGTRTGLQWGSATKLPKEKKRITYWSAIDKRNLLKDRIAGMNYTELTKKYGRTESAISNKLWILRHGG